MGLDLWFREDVARILDALAAAGDLRGPEYHKALSDVARAFGVAAPPAPTDNGAKVIVYTPPRQLEGWK